MDGLHGRASWTGFMDGLQGKARPHVGGSTSDAAFAGLIASLALALTFALTFPREERGQSVER